MEYFSFEAMMNEVASIVTRRTIKMYDEMLPLSDSERVVVTRALTMCESLLRMDDSTRKISDVREELLALVKKAET